MASKKTLYLYLSLLVPIAWFASRFDPYQIDGDAVSYMDIADLLRAHHWAGAVNAYWHPLYPALLALGQTLFHTTRATELGAYYTINFFIFLAQIAAMLLFVRALDTFRTRSTTTQQPLLSANALSLLGIGLLVIASQRELSMGKVRPDALLQALMLVAFAMLLNSLAVESFLFPSLMGLFFGLAYLTKSFAFLVALLSIALMMLWQAWLQKRSFIKVAAGGALACIVFAVVAGPYMAALSHQKHRFDFGDSGPLNYAWYSAGVEKMHLEPESVSGSKSGFATSQVNLIHPEQQLLAQPGIYSYRAEPYGTYPAWFDPTYFNERIIPHLNLPVLVHRDLRNVALVLRYLLNHPEAWILLALLLAAGARFGFLRRRKYYFWMPMILLDLAMWGIYGLVNIEERYVALAYLIMLLSVFAMLVVPAKSEESTVVPKIKPWLPEVAAAIIVLMAFLALGESLRVALEQRRSQEVSGLAHAWSSPEIIGTAQGLQKMGVRPGDEVACLGTLACLNDIYWARAASVRVLTEVYSSDAAHLEEQLNGLPNLNQVYDIVKGQGAKVLVGRFDPASMTGKTAGSAGWVRLGETDFYALPMNLPAAAQPSPVTVPWPAAHPGP